MFVFVGMDILTVRFYFGGEFILGPRKLQYVRGRSAMSSIELDKISLPEIMGHLKDHICTSTVMHLHWLCPGKELAEGLMLLVDDASCLMMAVETGEGEVADIYVEEIYIEQGTDDEGENEPMQPEQMQHEPIYVEQEQMQDEQMQHEPMQAEQMQDLSQVDVESPEKEKYQDKDYRSFMEFYRSPAKPSPFKLGNASTDAGTYEIHHSTEGVDTDTSHFR